MQAEDVDTVAPVCAILALTPQMDNADNVAFTRDVDKQVGEDDTSNVHPQTMTIGERPGVCMHVFLFPAP
jgi:hypothetical protein